MTLVLAHRSDTLSTSGGVEGLRRVASRVSLRSPHVPGYTAGHASGTALLRMLQATPSPQATSSRLLRAILQRRNQSVRNRRRRQRPLKKLNRPSEQPRKKATPPNNPPVPPPMPSPRSGVNLFDQARERFGNQPVRNRRRRQRPLKKLNRPSEQPRRSYPHRTIPLCRHRCRHPGAA